MNWEDLVVCGCRGVYRETGVAIRNPLVRTNAGSLHLLADVDSLAPKLGTRISAREFDSCIENGTLVAVPERAAEAQHVILYVSRRFLEVVEGMGVGVPVNLEGIDSGALVTYLTTDRALELQEEWATALITAARDQLRSLFEQGSDGARLKAIEDALHQARYVCARGSARRGQMYELLGVTLTERDPTRLGAELETAALELEVSIDDVRARVKKLRTELGAQAPTTKPVIFGEEVIEASNEPILRYQVG